MASKAFAVWGSYVPHVGRGDSGSRRAWFALNWKRDTERSCKLRCFGVSGDLSALLATEPTEEENRALPTVELQRLIDQYENNEPRRSQKDMNSLPRPLSVTNLSSSANDGSEVRVAYQGVPGAYSQAAALKAYPQCETVPCDQFEDAFKAVELWLVDKAVLPIENSLGGSIHRNYDLLLCHRLHIVGEVQLAVNHCLGLPGVRKEELKRVLSHPQVSHFFFPLPP
ncbi:arogenate dehydratase/prephenate dehydratase 1, chloroplastic-like [Macadamia integrifolia]|uniref:arogenate dehydratase/prephenate dehydratase 1, chloroplastic-like n=1 Tax=Macadamia integrifolia TaxID=60698 RepID=UPI001C52920A|nr:arogenate dehydratase/prephenate dehydratase 1, chloroplastic-like [Macadamia integrifolia]